MPRSAVVTAPATARAPVFNKRLKMAMIDRGVQQQDVALRLHIDPIRMSRIVNGRREPTPDEQDRIADFLGKPRRWLFWMWLP